MFLRKIKIPGNSLLFRLTILYTLTFTLLAIISFAVFYYQIYSVTMERMDEELLEEIEYYAGYLAKTDLAGLKKKLINEAEPEDSEEDKFTVIEDTDDWYIQHIVSRDVLYMGEIAVDFELDLDGELELVEIEGSWKSGKDSAKPGILMWGNPDPENEDHNLYRQEFALGNAEDVSGVISRGEESVTVRFGIYTDDVVQTKDWTPIEPDVLEFKYYAPGVGMIREEDPESGEYVVLVNKTTVP